MLMYSLELQTNIAGESGMVYRGYIKTAVGNKLVAVKTGKGIVMYCLMLCIVRMRSSVVAISHVYIILYKLDVCHVSVSRDHCPCCTELIKESLFSVNNTGHDSV